jgi:hypothetical protein
VHLITIIDDFSRLVIAHRLSDLRSAGGYSRRGARSTWSATTNVR